MQFSKGCCVHLLCFLDVFKENNSRNILLNFNHFAGIASSSFASPVLCPLFCRVHIQGECLGNLWDPFVSICWIYCVGRIYCRILVCLERERPELQLEWGWIGVGLSVPQVPEQCWGAVAKKQMQTKKCCTGISAWMWKNTKAFFFSLISQCLSSVCYQGRRKAISSVHSDFILIQLLYWL